MSEIVRSVTGAALGEYLHQRLFLPLGIGLGVETSPPARRRAARLYLRPEDMTKLGVLWLDGGGEGANPAARVGAGGLNSAHAHTEKVRQFQLRLSYLDSARQLRLFNGMFGQNVFMFLKTTSLS